MRGTDSYVAALDSTNHVHFKPVRVASNDGRTVAFSEGVDVGDRLALAVGGAVRDGALVRVPADSTLPRRTP